MKLTRREPPEIGISFLDTITCGIGAIILLMTVTTTRPHTPEAPVDDPRAAQISELQRELFAVRAAAEAATADAQARLATQKLSDEELKRIKAQIAALLGSQANDARADQDAAMNAAIYGQLKTAQQRLTAEMEQLYAQKNRPKARDLIGGIPVDSEYICFIIDTSGSMFNYAWPKVLEQIVETLTVYPRVKGLQVMNDEGSYMFPEYAGDWIPDTPARRRAVIERLSTWNAFSNSSPSEGIEAAIEQFYRPDRKISLYVYGDEFTGKSISDVANFVRRLNRPDRSGVPRVRIHAIGFPTQFANPPSMQMTGIRFSALMRELTRQNGGSFVGLNSFR
jgi:hypothetical protein